MVGPVIFDAVKRYLTYSGYKVTLVINITDVDDKLINESNSRGMTMPALAEEMTADYMRNLAAMGIDTVDHFPRATDNIDEIIKLTQTLIDKGFAYESDGDVYFDVARDPQYGKLSNRDVASMLGEGGEMAERKRSPADFALWKSAKPGRALVGQPLGQGPAGLAHRVLGHEPPHPGRDVRHPRRRARPGLSASRKRNRPERVLPRQAAGQILDAQRPDAGLERSRQGRRPRHARSRRRRPAGQEAGKLGKSKGAALYASCSSATRPKRSASSCSRPTIAGRSTFSEGRIEEVGTGLEQFYRFFKRYERISGQSFYATDYAKNRPAGDFDPGADATLRQIAEHRRKFLEAMDDDFNTGGAVGDLFELVRTLNKYADDQKLENRKPDEAQLATLRRGAITLRELGATLGLFRAASAKPSAGNNLVVDKLMALIIELRAAARGKKDFATADRIRQVLGEVGIMLEDRPGGTEWTLP